MAQRAAGKRKPSAPSSDRAGWQIELLLDAAVDADKVERAMAALAKRWHRPGSPRKSDIIGWSIRHIDQRRRAAAIRLEVQKLLTSPLFRARVLRIDPYVVLVLHHIITDNWSLSYLAREALRLARALLDLPLYPEAKSIAAQRRRVSARPRSRPRRSSAPDAAH